VLELGIIVDYIIIGISLGASQSLDTTRYINQLFEGTDIGSYSTQHSIDL